MAKRLPKKNQMKNRSIKYIDVDGKNRILKVKTNCNIFGQCSVDAEGNFLYHDGLKKCEKCASEQKSACIVKMNPEIKAVVARKAGSTPRSKKPFDCAIDLWLTGFSKKEIIEYLVAEKEMKESAAKRFTNDIFSVGKAAIGQARKKDGLINRYLEWALNSDRKNPAPEGCKVTLGFCKPYAEIFKEYTI